MNPKTVKLTGTLIIYAWEAIVLAEILWYALHDGETLHDAARDYITELRERVRTRGQAMDTLDHIRDLPETE